MCVDKLKKFFSQIDKMYHIEAVQIIVLYVSCILALIFNKACPSFKHSQWLAFAIGNVVAIAAIILKEYYDFKHPDKHSYEKKDIIAGLVGLVTADIPLICAFI